MALLSLAGTRSTRLSKTSPARRSVDSSFFSNSLRMSFFVRVRGLVGSPSRSISSAGGSLAAGGGGRLGPAAGRFRMLAMSSISGVTAPKILANPDPAAAATTAGSGLGLLKAPGRVGRGGRGDIGTAAAGAAGGGGLDGVTGRELACRSWPSSGSCMRSMGMGLGHGDGDGDGECEWVDGWPGIGLGAAARSRSRCSDVTYSFSKKRKKTRNRFK